MKSTNQGVNLAKSSDQQAVQTVLEERFYKQPAFIRLFDRICNGCNMAMGGLPDMCARGPRARSPRACILGKSRMVRPPGTHIRQIPHGHVTSIMYHFVPIVTTPVV